MKYQKAIRGLNIWTVLKYACMMWLILGKIYRKFFLLLFCLDSTKGQIALESCNPLHHQAKIYFLVFRGNTTVFVSLPVSSSRSPCSEESVSSEEAWLLQLTFPIHETRFHTSQKKKKKDGYTKELLVRIAFLKLSLGITLASHCPTGHHSLSQKITGWP